MGVCDHWFIVTKNTLQGFLCVRRFPVYLARLTQFEEIDKMVGTLCPVIVGLNSKTYVLDFDWDFGIKDLPFGKHIGSAKT